MSNNGLKRTVICLVVLLGALFSAHIAAAESGLVANGAADQAQNAEVVNQIAQLETGLARVSGQAETLDAQQVEATIKRVANWQLANPVPYKPGHWTMAPLYDGLIDTSLVTGDPKYLAPVIRAGLQVAWKPGPRTYHADDHAAGHAWLRIYLMNQSQNS